jgi:thioesterase domain-containing protein/acyl carrier protein
MNESPDLKTGLPEDREGLVQAVRTVFPDLQTAEDAFEVPTWFPRQNRWVEDPVGSENAVYNFPLMLHIRGPLDHGALRKGLQEIVRRHGVFRSVFRILEGRLVQVVLPPQDLLVPVQHLDGIPEEYELKIQEIVRMESMRPFDLTLDSLLRCTLIRRAADDWVLLLVTHTLVYDDWSSGVFIRELSENYGTLTDGGTPLGLNLPFQFGDFVRWQRPRLQGPELESHLAFWRQQLASTDGFEHMAPDFARPAKNSHEGAKHTAILPVAQVNSLMALSRQERVSLFMVLLSGFKCLLHYYSGDEEIGVAACAANRQLEEVEGLIGRFGNSTLLKTSLSGNPTFSELFRRVQEVTLEALSHLEVPFGMLLEKLGGAVSPSRARPFQMMFILQNAPKESWHLPGLSVEWAPLETTTSKLDLIVWLKTEPRLEITLEYASQVFAASTMRKLLVDYQSVLETIARDPKRRINDSPVSSMRESAIAKVGSVSASGIALAMDKSAVEHRMVEIWKSVFSPREVDTTKNFFESGGDSLLAVRLFAQINREFQCKMPLSVLLGAPTIEELVQIVFAREPISSSSLVPVQPLGSRPPLFFVHASAGEPTGSLELSRCLGPDQPVYGLRSRNLCGDSTRYSIPEMAEYYVKCIRGVQPKGPYYLSGFCFGGLVAYEMARFLTSQNEDVALLAIFDSPAPGSLRILDCVKNRIRHDFWKLRRREVPLSFPILATRTRRVASLAANSLKVTISSVAGNSGGNSPETIEQELLAFSKAHIAAAKNYFPGDYPGPITLFLTSEAFALYGYDLYEQWLAFGRGGIELHSSDGEHLRQLEDPFVKTLAAKLRKCIAEADTPKQGSPPCASDGLGRHAPSLHRGKEPGALARPS